MLIYLSCYSPST